MTKLFNTLHGMVQTMYELAEDEKLYMDTDCVIMISDEVDKIESMYVKQCHYIDELLRQIKNYEEQSDILDEHNDLLKQKCEDFEEYSIKLENKITHMEKLLGLRENQIKDLKQQLRFYDDLQDLLYENGFDSDNPYQE